ncbi:MAG TPA: zinc ribbon domain-containing protein, partial [Actinomycetes bacterium]
DREIPIRGPEIITPERMAQLRKALAATARVRPAFRVYPLSGRIFGACGVPFNGIYRNDYGHRNQRRYECRYNDPKFNGTDKRCYCQRIDADWLDETVWAEVSTVLSDPDRLLMLARKHLDMRGGELRAEASQIGSLDRRLAEAKRKRTNLALAAAASGPEAVADALAEINRDIEALEQMQEQARAWARANAERTALVRNLWRFAEVARERLDDPKPERMREVFDALDIRVQVVREGARRGRRRNPPDVRITGVLPIGNLHEVASSTGR